MGIADIAETGPLAPGAPGPSARIAAALARCETAAADLERMAAGHAHLARETAAAIADLDRLIAEASADG